MKYDENEVGYVGDVYRSSEEFFDRLRQYRKEYQEYPECKDFWFKEKILLDISSESVYSACKKLVEFKEKQND